MQVILNFEKHSCIVRKEDRDFKIYSDSLLLHRVKKELYKQGHNVIKKRMWKDGHLVSDSEHYIRERKGEFCIWWPNYAVEFAFKDFNKGQVILRVEMDDNSVPVFSEKCFCRGNTDA